jgi:hypothetical protein
VVNRWLFIMDRLYKEDYPAQRLVYNAYSTNHKRVI